MLFFLLFLVNSFYRINGINITSIRYQGAYLIQIECKWNDNKKTLNPIDLNMYSFGFSFSLKLLLQRQL